MTDSTTTDRPVSSSDCQTAVLMFDEFLSEFAGPMFSQLSFFVERMTAVADACGDPIAREAVMGVIAEVEAGAFDNNGKKLVTMENRLLNQMLDLRNFLTPAS